MGPCRLRRRRSDFNPVKIPMRIALHIPCIVDQWMPEIGISMLRVLERLGPSVTYNPAQTC